MNSNTTAPLPRTLSGHVAAELHRLILDGTLAAGSMLRIQEVAERFSTSSMPVREALRILDAMGLVEVIPHRGTRVAELTRADLEDTYRTRITLETIAIRDAARHPDPVTVTEATALLRRHSELLEAGDISGARLTHADFHFRLYADSGSRWLLRAIEAPWRNSERYAFVLGTTPQSRHSSRIEHEAMLGAYADGSPERAADAVRWHLESACERISAAMA